VLECEAEGWFRRVANGGQDLVLPDPDAPTAPSTDSSPSATATSLAPAFDSSLAPRTVSYAEALAFATAEGLAGYVETSARTGNNVTSAFDKVTRQGKHKLRCDLLSRKVDASTLIDFISGCSARAAPG